jgi:hypothetical protein
MVLMRMVVGGMGGQRRGGGRVVRSPMCLCRRLGPVSLFPLVHSLSLVVDRAPQDRVAEHQSDCAHEDGLGRRGRLSHGRSSAWSERRRQRGGCSDGPQECRCALRLRRR